MTLAARRRQVSSPTRVKVTNEPDLGPVKPTAKKGRKQVAGGSKSKEKVDEYGKDWIDQVYKYANLHQARDADAEPDAANNCNNNKDHDVPGTYSTLNLFCYIDNVITESRSATRAKSGKKSAGSVRSKFLYFYHTTFINVVIIQLSPTKYQLSTMMIEAPFMNAFRFCTDL